MCVFLPHFPSFSWSSQASSLGPSHLGHSHERVPGCQSPRCHLMGWCGQNSPLFFLWTPSRDLNSFFQQQGPCPYITNTGETICQPRTEELRWQLIFAASVDLKRPVFSPLRSSLLWTRPACSESLRAGSFQVPYTQRTFSNTVHGQRSLVGCGLWGCKRVGNDLSNWAHMYMFILFTLLYLKVTQHYKSNIL